MEPSARWWNRRTRASASSLILVVVAVAVVAAALGVTAVIRLPARGTTCNAATASAEVFPTLAGIGPASGPTATGTVIRGNGVILTALAGLPDGTATSTPVTLSDGETVPAAVVGTDAPTGLAVLKIDRQQLPFLLLSPREPVRAGLPVVALGSPLLADSAVLTGTVQSVGTAAEVSRPQPWKLTDAVVTDLAAASGNLGAPVVTCDNRMIGVVVGQASDGTAVVVPAEVAERTVTRLLGLS